MQFIDTHTHLYTEEFDADRAEMMQRAIEAGAKHLLLPNIDEASLPRMLQMCSDYPSVCLPMLGLHPTELPPAPTPLLDRMESLLTAASHPYIAIGEVGIDLYWDDTRREEQIAVFRRQIEWAIRFHLPLVIHSRNAHRDIIDTLLPYRDRLCGGVFHCFGGTEDEAREMLSLFPNFQLGIGGVLTFKKSTLPATLLSAVPLDRIVVETDAPYLSPTPHRGKRNEPAYIPLVLAKLAEIYALPLEDIARRTTQTARRTFRLPEQS